MIPERSGLNVQLEKFRTLTDQGVQGGVHLNLATRNKAGGKLRTTSLNLASAVCPTVLRLDPRQSMLEEGRHPSSASAIPTITPGSVTCPPALANDKHPGFKRGYGHSVDAITRNNEKYGRTDPIPQSNVILMRRDSEKTKLSITGKDQSVIIASTRKPT